MINNKSGGIKWKKSLQEGSLCHIEKLVGNKESSVEIK